MTKRYHKPISYMVKLFPHSSVPVMWLVVWNNACCFFQILGSSSSQLTKSCFRGVGEKPPTSRHQFSSWRPVVMIPTGLQELEARRSWPWKLCENECRRPGGCALGIGYRTTMERWDSSTFRKPSESHKKMDKYHDNTKTLACVLMVFVSVFWIIMI